MVQKMFSDDQLIDAMRKFDTAVKEKGLTSAEVALRWVMHHSALTEDALKSHDVPKQYTAADGISDKEARVNKGIFNALSLIINKVKGEGTSSLTEPLLQSDTKIGNGDEMLV